MYAPKIVLQQVIKLFTELPEYRDDRYGTIKYIVETHYLNGYGKSICTDFKLMSDIDRSFRYVQQFSPELRGKTWFERQRRAGEMTKEEYRNVKKMEKEVKYICKQMKINFE